MKCELSTIREYNCVPLINTSIRGPMFAVGVICGKEANNEQQSAI